MPDVIEQVIEDYLVKRVKGHGGEVRKLKWIGRRSAPDRVVFLNGVYFVELKRPGKVAELAQAREHKRLKRHGARVCTLNTKEQVDEFIATITRSPEKWAEFSYQKITKN